MICPHCQRDTEEKPRELDWLLQNRFDDFWRAYWRKRDKGHAIKAFKRICTSEEIFARIMNAIREQTPEMLRRERDKVPYPATWLNGLCFEDEAPGAKGQTPAASRKPEGACYICWGTGVARVSPTETVFCTCGAPHDPIYDEVSV